MNTAAQLKMPTTFLIEKLLAFMVGCNGKNTLVAAFNIYPWDAFKIVAGWWRQQPGHSAVGCVPTAHSHE